MKRIHVKRDWVESIVELRLPRTIHDRIRWLTDRNNDGTLTDEEVRELEGFVELSEPLSLVRAGALRALNAEPR